VTLESIIPGINQKAAKLGKLVFHTVGDTGGIKHPLFQQAVADAMKRDLHLAEERRPTFFYHLGDVIYYNGQISEYLPQFYEPYDGYTPPIIAIPGNHDGEPIDKDQTSLDGWVRYFMADSPRINPEASQHPRVTLSLANVFYTLVCPFVTIVGMYTNVPEGGSVDSIQQQWLTNELATAPTDKALIVALHHPIYSFDNHHSGSARMADVVQHAINDSRRVPNMVLTAHVHNYQRFEQQVGDVTVPFLVIGNGGYYNLHSMTGSEGDQDSDTGARLIKENHKKHGYATLTVSEETISGTVTLVQPNEDPEVDFDTFSYPAKAIRLPDGVVVSL
jgi:hypothetical protein